MRKAPISTRRSTTRGDISMTTTAVAPLTIGDAELLVATAAVQALV
ncbi:hypothetical protein ABZV75_08545 [Streptomyces flaveolus]